MKAPRLNRFFPALRAFISRTSWYRRLAGPALGLLLFSGVVANVWVHAFGLPSVASTRSPTARWYLKSGQLQADFRTVCAAARFVWGDTLPLVPGTAQPPTVNLVLTNTV